MGTTITLSVWPFALGAAYLAGCATPFLVMAWVAARKRRRAGHGK